MCQEHPEAGTYTSRVTHCRECHVVVDTHVGTSSGPPVGSVAERGESRPKLGLDPHVGNGRPKMGVDVPRHTAVRGGTPADALASPPWKVAS